MLSTSAGSLQDLQNSYSFMENLPNPRNATNMSGADIGGGCRGWGGGAPPPPPPQMTCGFLIRLVFCKKRTMWFKRERTRVHPLLNKILDPPLYVISRWLLRADLRNNQPDVFKIVKNDTYFFPRRILYNTFVLRLLGEVVRTFYPTIFSLWPVPTEWTKIERKYSSMHFQRLMYSKIKIAR